VVDSVESVPDFTEFGRLDSRGAVVIGARQGIGRHTAHALRTAGAQVAVVDLNPQLAAELAAEVDGIAITAEVRKEADIPPAMSPGYQARLQAVREQRIARHRVTGAPSCWPLVSRPAS